MDPDQSTVPSTTITDLIQYENLKIKNLYKPWTVYYKFPKVMATGSNVVLRGGYQDCGSPIGIGVVGVYTDSVSLSQTYGTIISTIYLVAKNRR